MEIPAPDHPITSWKETAKHLAIITAGVLIALALEGVVAWADHRLLVREAVANLTSEIRANKKELDGMFSNVEKERKELEHADEIAAMALARKLPGKMSLSLTTHAAELKNAAVTTGQITGAFGFMDYSAVRRYADVYDLQAQFMRLQERDGQDFRAVFSMVSRIVPPETPAPAALEEWRLRISTALADIFIREQMAQQLLKRYDELLAGH